MPDPVAGRVLDVAPAPTAVAPVTPKGWWSIDGVLPSIARTRLHDWLAERFELGRGGGRHNLPAMEGLRGFAVFLVFLVHYVTLVQPWTTPALGPIASGIHAIGNTGVDLFFVLSGYLIYGSLIERSVPFRAFIARRAERIYPAFLAVFALYLVLSAAFPRYSKLPAAAGDAIVYVAQNLLLLPGIFPIEPIITVAWSLSYEAFFYLALPVVIGALALRRWTPAWRIGLFAAAVLLMLWYCARYGGHVRLVMFGAGILLFELAEHQRVPVPPVPLVILGLLGAFAVMLLPLDGSAGYAVKIACLFISFGLLCRAAFRSRTSWLARVLAWTPVRWLGNMSYSYYLLHGLTLKAAFIAMAFVVPAAPRHASLFWVLLPPAFLVSLVPSAILFLVIERPFSLRPARRTA